MNLSKGTIFMAIAGLVGLVAMYVMHSYISAKTKVAVNSAGQVLVAAADISPGTAITQGLVKTVNWPQELMPPNAASSLNQLEGRVVSSPLSAGEPILFTKLAPEGAYRGLAGLLAEGRRALSVRVDDVSGVAGFVHPGDHVDVLVEMAMPDGKEHFSKTILQNIAVLSAGQVWEQILDQKPVVVNTVTLVLTSEQAEILNLASNQGRIRLALRNRNDVAPVETSGVDTSTLLGAVRKEAAKIVEKSEMKERNVEVIKGLERSRVNL
jgi:pilus assembly protein CpaB